MLRKMIRVVSILAFVVSAVLGSFAAYVYFTPSDEEKLYEQKHQEAMTKLQKAQAAKGTPAELLLAKEAKDASDSAEIWGRGYRERLTTNRLALLATGAGVFISVVVFLLTLVKTKASSSGTPQGSWNNQYQNFN